MLAVVPHLLGFHPQLSFVVIGAGGPRQRLEIGFRYNLPDPPGAEAAAEIADHAVAVLAQRGITTVIAIGYGPGRLVTPVADAFAAAARRRRLHLRELLRVENSRYWSYPPRPWSRPISPRQGRTGAVILTSERGLDRPQRPVPG
jgi:hypothetical protein